jgi:MFS family permease
MLSFATSPYIVTTWIGGPLSDAFIDGPGWRWGFGIFAIITPVVVVPLILLFALTQRKAKKLGLAPSRQENSSSAFQTVKEFVIQFDLLGVLLLAAGLALFLLPLSIYSYQTLGWKSPMIICMLTFGGLLVIVFLLYEKYWAPVNFIPVHLLADRTVLFSGLMLVFVFFNSAVWGSYFTSMLMVAFNQSVTKATYISNIYRVGSCFSAFVIGYFVRLTGRFKWVAVYFSIPLMILGVGLMIEFREPDSNVGLVIMTQIFIAFAGGPIVVAAEMAMMACVDHQHIAAILAINDLFGSVGTALGSTVSAAIWTSVFPAALEAHLPAGSPIDDIYESIYTQLGYRVGTPVRTGIGYAYADAQQYMLITAVALLGAAWICAFMWRDIKIKDIHQVKGNVI